MDYNELNVIDGMFVIIAFCAMFIFAAVWVAIKLILHEYEKHKKIRDKKIEKIDWGLDHEL